MRYFLIFLVMLPFVFTSPSKRFLLDSFGRQLAIHEISQWIACNPGMTHDTCVAECPKLHISHTYYCGLVCSSILKSIQDGHSSVTCATG